MQRTRMTVLMTALVALAALVAWRATIATAQEPKDGEKEKAKVVCPVSGKPINKQHSAAYKQAKVYFCCPNCPKAFAKDTKKFATKANRQLVKTAQYAQQACPVTGRKLNPAQKVKVTGVEVTFCCPNCKGKVAGLDKAKKVEAVFAEKPFAKAFKPKKQEDPA